MVLSLFLVYNVEAGWYNSSWDYRKEITVSDEIDDYQTRLVIYKNTGVYNCSNHCNVDFSDLRFTNASGDGLIPYWIEEYTSGSNATVWFKNLYNESTLYMYYGNSGASDASDGEDTFVFFDDFSGTTMDSAKWDVINTLNDDWSVDGYMSVSDDGFIATDDTFGFNLCFDAYAVTTEQDSSIIEIRESTANENDINSFSCSDAATPCGDNGDFNDYRLYNRINGGSSYSDCISNWGTITNYNVYSLYRISTSKIVYEQNYDDSHTRTTIIADGSVYMGLRVWDSSADSTTTYDWARIRLYYESEPSISFGVEQTDSVNSNPVNSVPNPSNTATGVGLSLDDHSSHFNITVNDGDGNSMNITWHTNESGSWTTFNTTTGGGSGVANGTYYASNVSWVDSYSTVYWWSVNTSDGNGGWDNDTFSFTTYSLPVTKWSSSSFGGSVEVTFIPSLSFSIVCSSGSGSDEFHFQNWSLGATGTGFTTQYNVSEDNQTVSVPALNITNTGNVALNFSMYWVSKPGSGISMKYNTSDSAPYPSVNLMGIEEANETVIISNLGTSSFEEIWLWMDFISVSSGSGEVNVTIVSSQYES